jgi:hypothetical protein
MILFLFFFVFIRDNLLRTLFPTTLHCWILIKYFQCPVHTNIRAFAATKFNKIFVRSTASSNCESSPTFQELSPSPYSRCYRWLGWWTSTPWHGCLPEKILLNIHLDLRSNSVLIYVLLTKRDAKCWTVSVLHC